MIIINRLHDRYTLIVNDVQVLETLCTYDQPPANLMLLASNLSWAVNLPVSMKDSRMKLVNVNLPGVRMKL